MQSKPNVEELMKAATATSEDAAAEQRIIDVMNDKQAKRAMKLTGWYDYANINRAYFQARYGKYALAGATLAVTGAYVAAFFLAPTLIPFGLAAITTAYVNYIITAAMALSALYSGYIFLTSSAKEFKALMTRATNTLDAENTDRKLSKHDVALLTTATLAGSALVTMLYAFPTLLPVLGTLGGGAKLGVAATSGLSAAVTGFAAYKGFFAAAPVVARATTDEGKELGLDHEDSMNPFVTTFKPTV